MTVFKRQGRDCDRPTVLGQRGKQVLEGVETLKGQVSGESFRFSVVFAVKSDDLGLISEAHMV